MYGVPMPTLIWQVSPDGAAWTDLTDSGPYSGVTTPTLTITGTPLSLNGLRFRVLATSVAGTVESVPATLTVSKVVPVVTWARPARIIVGTPLGARQFNATVNVPGTVVYTPPAGTVLGVGQGHALSVDFTPDDPTNYATVSRTVTIDVSADGGGTPDIITTVAGTGVAGFSGDGGPATQAEMNSPFQVITDGAGNVYFTDTQSHRVRKVTAANGVITTVAGTGSPGYSGDGGAATAAELNSPFGLALDTAENLYIADRENHAVRRVDAVTGLISTVVGTGVAGFGGDGGPATAAMLRAPLGIAFDANGSLHVSDSDNVRIRAVDALTGIITTVAGTGYDGFAGDGGPATAARTGTSRVWHSTLRAISIWRTTTTSASGWSTRRPES